MTPDQPGNIPLLDPLPQGPAVIEPSRVHVARDIPGAAVACFFQEVMRKLVANGTLRELTRLRSEIGDNPVYGLEYRGRELAVFHPGVGCPLAAGFLESMIALGAKSFVACGGAGVLDSAMAVGTLVVPSSAVRDEGTSFHYLPPSREIEVPEAYLRSIRATLDRHGCRYVVGKTWTTDAFYRETRERVALRRSEGCLTVEMEASAFFAVARFRRVPFAQLLYGGDDVGGEVWDQRDWDRNVTVREKLFWLAAEASLDLAEATRA